MVLKQTNNLKKKIMGSNFKTKKAEVLAKKLQVSIEAQICLINQLINEIDKSDSISEINRNRRILNANLTYRKAVLYDNICRKYGITNRFNGSIHNPLQTITSGYDFLGR